jgi:hypothetical protein
MTIDMTNNRVPYGLLTNERDEAWRRAGHAEEQWGRCEVKLSRAVDVLSECLERNAFLEARLGKAVEGLREIYGNGDATGRNPQLMVNIARAVIAEIELVSKEGEQP